MNPLMEAVHAVSPSVAGGLIASAWQGVLLTAVVALALRVLRPVTPTVRTTVWTAVLLLMLFLPMLNMMAPHEVMPAGHKEFHVAQTWSLVLLSLWGLLSLGRAVRLAANAVRLWRLAGRATPVTVEGRVAALLQGVRPAVLCLSSEIDRPSVTGFVRPRVLLPLGLMESLSGPELEHVVLHEMEHLRRYDDWLNLLQQISLVLLPLNPALVWLDRILCRERELACDDGVLAATQARKAYAACLVKLAEDSLVRKGVALALSALGTRARKSELVGRVRRILAGPEQTADALRTRFALGVLAAGVLAGTATLARCPEVIRFDQGSSRELAEVQATLLPVPSSGMSYAEPRAMRVAAFDQGTARPMLAKAVIEQSSRRPAIAAWKPAGMERKATRWRPLGRRAASTRPALSWKTVPVVKAAAETAPRAENPVWQQSETELAAPARVVVTSFEVSQPVLAAVPWQGGWLVIEL